jgi:hypothetical protein
MDQIGVIMAKRLVILVAAIMLAAPRAGAQTEATRTAGGALRAILFEGGGGAFTENSMLALYGLLLGETTTFPTGTAAGGFSWVFDDNLQVPVRRSRSFGPMFAERPFTTGKGRLNIGAAYQHTTFSSVGGRALTELETLTSYRNGNEIYRYGSSLEVQLDRTIFSATYGVHDRIDLAAIVPFGTSRVSGFNSYFQLYQGETLNERIDSTGSSTGIGDVLIRAKAALIASKHFDVAATFDVRLATGDPEKLLGTGHTQARAMFIGGTTLGNVNPHVNLGYTFGGDGMTFGEDNRWIGSFGDPELIDRQPSEEFNYILGADIVATSRITIAGDLIGRVVRNTADIDLFDSGSASPDRLVFLEVLPGTVNLLLGAVGAKVSIGGAWLLTGTVLFPLNDNGIKPAVTPVIGFERAF